jgi:hypothetical protein
MLLSKKALRLYYNWRCFFTDASELLKEGGQVGALLHTDLFPEPEPGRLDGPDALEGDG